MNPVDNNKILIKMGGSILNDPNTMALLCNGIKTLKEAGYKIIVVHGGGKAINATLAIHGVQSTFEQGLRITSAAAIKIIEMVLCGQVNQTLVRKLNHTGIDAIGLSGAAHHLLHCTQYSEQHGFVGKIKAVNTMLIKQILSLQSIPVIASIGVDDHGQPLNINADMAACQIANALDVQQLIYLTDQDGIYDQNGQVLSQLTADDLQALIQQGVVTDGMLVKAKAILSSLKSGFKKIHILNGHKQQNLHETLFKTSWSGTVCY